MSDFNITPETILDAQILNLIHDRAREQAHALRQHAIEDLWRSANAVLATPCASARRSAQRLVYALARRQARLKLDPADTTQTA